MSPSARGPPEAFQALRGVDVGDGLGQGASVPLRGRRGSPRIWSRRAGLGSFTPARGGTPAPAATPAGPSPRKRPGGNESDDENQGGRHDGSGRLHPGSRDRSRAGPGWTSHESTCRTDTASTTAAGFAWCARRRPRVGRPVAVLADLQGPKLRLGRLESPVHLHDGATVTIAPEGDHSGDEIPTSYPPSGQGGRPRHPATARRRAARAGVREHRRRPRGVPGSAGRDRSVPQGDEPSRDRASTRHR